LKSAVLKGRLEVKTLAGAARSDADITQQAGNGETEQEHAEQEECKNANELADEGEKTARRFGCMGVTSL
jgi:hypothetical protein